MMADGCDSAVEYMDHGFHCISLSISVRIRLPCGAGQLEMGLRYWQYILCHHCPSHRIFHGRDVSLRSRLDIIHGT